SRSTSARPATRPTPDASGPASPAARSTASTAAAHSLRRRDPRLSTAVRPDVGYRVRRTGCAEDPHRAGSSTEGTRGAVRTAIVSTYPPRACGIGTFAADVRGALLGVDGVDRVERVVIVNEPSRPQRPGLVATIAQAARGDYIRAARILGRLDIDVVLLQHEYGIFGGRDGEYVLTLADELEQPLVITLHTVLSEPTVHQA